uniref:Epstein-Barr virus EBNA-1-like protein n=1 Tax=Oryza sativa subsp. japonica TaxID=39947 RepID=Q5VMG6_ORYSJ|nr:Epstein-Barr virus EBNA-1-like protein [Oryza sativa Japonica Group]
MGAREVRRTGFGCAGLRSGAPVGRMAAGPHAVARLSVDRAHGREVGGRGRLTGLAQSKPRWRRRGAYVAATRAGGRRKKGRPRWTADGGRVHRSKRDGFGLRGAHRSDEGVEKERANGSDFAGGSSSAESASGVGWGGRAPRRAGDERRPPGAGGNGGEAMPGGGGSRGGVYADGRSTARGELSGLGPGKGKKKGGRSPLRLLAHTPASPARATAKGGELKEGEGGRRRIGRLTARGGIRRTAWMCWAAKAVDRAVEIEPREREEQRRLARGELALGQGGGGELTAAISGSASERKRTRARERAVEPEGEKGEEGGGKGNSSLPFRAAGRRVAERRSREAGDDRVVGLHASARGKGEGVGSGVGGKRRREREKEGRRRCLSLPNTCDARARELGREEGMGRERGISPSTGGAK